MALSSDVHLIPVKLDRLRPTQMTVGYREVRVKRKHWKTLGRKARQAEIDSHWFPAVLGPGNEYYITDHHHLGLALIEEGVGEVRAMLLKDMSWLDDATFWRMMDHNQWVHPFDARGERRNFRNLPKALTKLVDDPYRSLAGAMRTAGGYAKDAAPFSEFLWADYLRPHIAVTLIRKDFPKALADAMALAHEQDARYLPGWSGVMEAQG